MTAPFFFYFIICLFKKKKKTKKEDNILPVRRKVTLFSMDSINNFTICGSPIKQMSSTEKNMIRSKIIKETPQKFYSNRNIFNRKLYDLTNPYSINNDTAKENQKNISLNNTPDNTNNYHQNFSVFLENPILNKFINKSINREFEFHKLIINIVSLFILTLFIKILKLTYHIFNNNNNNNNSHINKLNNWNFYSIKFFQLLFENIDNIKYLLNLIISFNIIVSLIKLLSYSKFNTVITNSSTNNISTTSTNKPYKLSNRQKDLLGLNQNETHDTDQYLMKKPYKIQLDNNINTTTTDPGNHGDKLVPKTPYIFKSLNTPLQKDIQLQSQQDNGFVQSTLNNHLKTNNNNNFNIFKKPYTTTTTTMETSTLSNSQKFNYTPSNKYAYLMNSPSPMKRKL